MNRSFVLLLFLVVLFSTGCRTEVRFMEHNAFQTPKKINEPLVIVVPDYYGTAVEPVRVADKFDVTYYQIYYGESLSTQALARFRNKFSHVVLMTDTEYAIARKSPPLGDQFQISDSQLSKQPSMNQISKPIQYAPSFVKEDVGYILRLRDVNFEFSGNRAYYQFNAVMLDRTNSEIIFDGNISAKGTETVVTAYKDNTTERIRKSVNTAFTQAFISIEKEMDKKLSP